MLGKIKRILKKPPSYIFWRLKYEAKAEMARFFEPVFADRLTESKLCAYFNSDSIHKLWFDISQNPYFAKTQPVKAELYESMTSRKADEIFRKAQSALDHKVTLLGLQDHFLGKIIDWGKDYKTDRTWSKKYFRSIDYVNLETSSDVKIPWEISRFQWMMPMGQAYLFDQDEKYAEECKNLFLSWIEQNPFAKGVNWACTMEVAIRITVLTWFFHVFKNAPSWNDPQFRFLFLKNLFLHAHFTIHHLEKSDINGNHYIADAMGLVFAGLFFGKEHKVSKKWCDEGLFILTDEIQKQIYEDGVDYEASTHYHRLVFEIFYFSQQYALLHNEKLPIFYSNTLLKMADYTAHYTQPDGMCPLIGDNDDARILPFGLQEINDHRYVTEFAYLGLGQKENLAIVPSDKTELFWLFESANIKTLDAYESAEIKSKAYPKGGYYIMRHEDNHIFINCAPLGLKGRGGHSHNDALSFELVLNGEKIITDSGSYVYTADYKARNKFRSTASHNTPYIEGVEINSFLGEKMLWSLKDEAKPECLAWEETEDYILFRGQHFGYQKLNPDLIVEREIKFTKKELKFHIKDKINHNFTTKFLITADLKKEDGFLVKTDTKILQLTTSGIDLKSEITNREYSLNYGLSKFAHELNITSNSFLEIEIKPK